ncbi:MAG: PIN domain nuclease [Candidatus Omnitrophica bacterium]|nr:PIN domain nuclease [Candidatus Omnitrophota bacterium]
MISIDLKKAAVDSNVVLSAVIGKSALRIFTHPDILPITTEFNMKEVEEYLPYFSSKYRMNETALLWQLKMLPMESFPEKYYKNYWAQAEKLLQGRDPDDIHLAALALKENIPIVSNDKDFEQCSILVYTTAGFLKKLEG